MALHLAAHQASTVGILFIVALSMIPYFMSFNLPKMIVKGPIHGKGFENPDLGHRDCRAAEAEANS